MRLLLSFFILVLAATPHAFTRHSAGPSDGQSGTVTRDTLERWMQRISNAGRWGPADERGTLNLITPAARARAASLVREGTTVSLAHEVVPGPNPRAPVPMSLLYRWQRYDSTVTWSFDSTTVVFHGWAYSHLDALSHTAWHDKMYNGFGTDAFQATGTQRLGVQNMALGIIGRAVLFDIPRLRGLPYLEPGTVITTRDLEAWQRLHKITLLPGDIVLIRTGRWARERALGGWDVTKGTAGPHPSIAFWLHGHDIAAMGGDVSNEFYPSLVAGISEPLHELSLVAMGMPLMDNLDFEELAQAAAQRGRWTFMFVAAPLRIRGGSGTLVNPLALF